MKCFQHIFQNVFHRSHSFYGNLVIDLKKTLNLSNTNLKEIIEEKFRMKIIQHDFSTSDSDRNFFALWDSFYLVLLCKQKDNDLLLKEAIKKKGSNVQFIMNSAAQSRKI